MLPRSRSARYLRRVRVLSRSFTARVLLALLAATFTSVQAIAHGIAHAHEAASAREVTRSTVVELDRSPDVLAVRGPSAEAADSDHATLHYTLVASRAVQLFVSAPICHLAEFCPRATRAHAAIPRRLVAQAARARSPAARPRAPPLS